MRWFDKQTCSFCHTVSYHEIGIAQHEQWWYFHGYEAKSGLIIGFGCVECSDQIYKELKPVFKSRPTYIVQAFWLPQLSLQEIITIREKS